MLGETGGEIVDLGAYRWRRLLLRYANPISARLSAIRCGDHGVTTGVHIEVDEDGVATMSFVKAPCCSSHAVFLYHRCRMLERELLGSMRSPGSSRD